MSRSPVIILKPFRRLAKGFTLAEVSIAMGVVSVGLLGLVSLLALALDGVREASSNMIGSQIASGLMGDLQSLPWDELAARDGGWSYYGAMGQKLDGETSGAGPSVEPASYTAHIRIEETRSFGCDVSICVINAAPSRGKQQIERYLAGNGQGYDVAVFTSQIVRLEK